jgi:hypothetical protein
VSSILFCTPCYGGMLHAAHSRSCMLLKEDLTKLGVEHDWLTGDRESLVHRGRMEMTVSFLNRKEFSHMMWLDADIEFTSHDVAALWNLNTDIAVGCYAMKKRDEQWFAAWKDGKLVKDLDQFKEPIEVDYAGTGFMLIRREVIETLAENLKQTERACKALVERLSPAVSETEAALLRKMLTGVAAEYDGPNGRVPALYMTPIINDGLESEDYHLCRIAREAGFKIIMDPAVRLGHWGQYRYGA